MKYALAICTLVFCLAFSPIAAISAGQGEPCDPATAGHGSKGCDGKLICRDTGRDSGYRCVGRGDLNDLCAKVDAGKGSKSCGGKLICRDTKEENKEIYRCIKK
jgi:hypothetical protein